MIFYLYRGDLNNFHLDYIIDNDEYLIIFHSNLKEYIAILFDSQFKVKNNNEKGKTYLTYYFENLLGDYKYDSIISSSMIFSKSKYFLFLAVYTDSNKNFTVNEINEEFNTIVEFDEFNISSFQSFSTNLGFSTFPIISSSLLSSSLLSNINIYSSQILSDSNIISSKLPLSIVLRRRVFRLDRRFFQFVLRAHLSDPLRHVRAVFD